MKDDIISKKDEKKKNPRRYNFRSSEALNEILEASLEMKTHLDNLEGDLESYSDIEVDPIFIYDLCNAFYLTHQKLLEEDLIKSGNLPHTDRVH